jgi:uncharacterized protein (DUF1800 family)
MKPRPATWLAAAFLSAALVAAAPDQPPDPLTAAVQKARAELTVAEKAATTARAARAEAEKAVGEAKTPAAKTAAQKALAQKAAAARAAANRLTSARTASERAVREKAFQGVADARAAVIQVEEERFKAEKLAKEKAAACDAARTAVGKAKAAAEKAPKDKASAGRLAAAEAACAKAAAAKATAEQAVAATDPALSAALAKLAAVRAEAIGGLKPLPADAWDSAKARHLLARAGFGGTPDEVEKLRALGLHRAVDFLVHYQKVAAPDIPFEATAPERPEPYERRLSAADQNRVTQRRQARENQQIQRMRAWWLRRMVESPRPLEEKLTLFWHGHFACEYQTLENSYMMFQQHRMFRQHANGNFGDLLHGLVHDATMIRYLNNDTNTKEHPNENLAREIMELFAMGLDQGYTEADIREAAKALTGSTFDWRSSEFRYAQARHDDGPKTIFGQTGKYTGDDVADLILRQPATARFIARKLFVFFAHDDPAPETIDRLAAVLRANNFELAPMLENLFASEEFYSARSVGTQIKSPVQLVVGAHRELGIQDGNYPFLAQAVRNMGQDLFQPPNVKGWDGGRTWVNAGRVFVRYNALAEALESAPRPGGSRGIDVVGTVLAGKTFATHAEVIDHLARTCLAGPLSPAKRQARVEFLAPLPPPSQWAARPDEANRLLTAAVVVLTSSPEYQLT